LSLVKTSLDHDIAGEKVTRFGDWPVYRQEIVTGTFFSGGWGKRNT
jgi:hypothetical protein